MQGVSMAFMFLGCTIDTEKFLASTPEAAVYEAQHDQSGQAVLAVFVSSPGTHRALLKQLPEAHVRSKLRRLEEPGLQGRKWGMVVTGEARVALLVYILWAWGRLCAQELAKAGVETGMHFSHQLAAALVSQSA
jgi:hypothetical protein